MEEFDLDIFTRMNGKSLDDFRPRGVAGVTTLSNGQIVLILDMKELLTDLNAHIDSALGVKRSKSLELSA